MTDQDVNQTFTVSVEYVGGCLAYVARVWDAYRDPDGMPIATEYAPTRDEAVRQVWRWLALDQAAKAEP